MNPALIASAIGLGTHLGGRYFNGKQSMTTEDTPQSARHHYEKLDDAATARVQKIAPDAGPLLLAPRVETTPGKDPRPYMAAQATVPLKSGRTAHKIYINPNTDAAAYAHELGHAVSQKTGPGQAVWRAKDSMRKNPMLSRSVVQALSFSVPAIGAALQEGDDDLAETIAIAAAMQAPTLIDEALATKNGLAIMQDAGIRANMGQRARLAGGYLSYLAPVIMTAAAGNFAGNLVDEHTALYDL